MDIATLSDGKVFKLCELSSNRDDKTLDKKRFERASRCRIIQKQFTDTHSITLVHGVTDLGHDIDFGGDIASMTSRQVLLGMKAKQDSSWPLFVSVNFDSYHIAIIAVIQNQKLPMSFPSYQCSWRQNLEFRYGNGYFLDSLLHPEFFSLSSIIFRYL